MGRDEESKGTWKVYLMDTWMAIISIAAIAGLVMSALLMAWHYGWGGIANNPTFGVVTSNGIVNNGTLTTTSLSVSNTLLIGPHTTTAARLQTLSAREAAQQGMVVSRKALATVSATPKPSTAATTATGASVTYYDFAVNGGKTTILDLTVGNFSCTGSGCPGSTGPVCSVGATTCGDSFPVVTSGSTSTFKTCANGACLVTSEIHSPETTGLVLRGKTDVELEVGNVTIVVADAAGINVVGDVEADSFTLDTETVLKMATGGVSTLTVDNAVVGGHALTVSAWAVCGNGIVEGSESCDPAPGHPDLYCNSHCQYVQAFPYYQVDGSSADFLLVPVTLGASSSTPVNPTSYIPAPLSYSQYGGNGFFSTTNSVGSITTVANLTGVTLKVDFSFVVIISATTVSASTSINCVVNDALGQPIAGTSSTQLLANVATQSIAFNLSGFTTTPVTLNSAFSYKPSCYLSWTGTAPVGPVTFTTSTLRNSATVLSH